MAWETFISQHSILIQVHDYKGLETRELEVGLIVAVVEYDKNRERRTAGACEAETRHAFNTSLFNPRALLLPKGVNLHEPEPHPACGWRTRSGLCLASCRCHRRRDDAWRQSPRRRAFLRRTRRIRRIVER